MPRQRGLGRVGACAAVLVLVFPSGGSDLAASSRPRGVLHAAPPSLGGLGILCATCAVGQGPAHGLSSSAAVAASAQMLRMRGGGESSSDDGRGRRETAATKLQAKLERRLAKFFKKAGVDAATQGGGAAEEPDSIPSGAVSWGSDASEWRASDSEAVEREASSQQPRQQQRWSTAPGIGAGSAARDGEAADGEESFPNSGVPERRPQSREERKTGGKRRGSAGDDEGQRTTKRRHVAGDELQPQLAAARQREVPAREGKTGAREEQRLDGGPRETVVTKDGAEAGQLVVLAARALDPDQCPLAEYFARYEGLVGELLRPWSDERLAWWARFPGYTEDVFSTGGRDGFQLAHAPPGVSLGLAPPASAPRMAGGSKGGGGLSGEEDPAAAAVQAVVARKVSPSVLRAQLDELLVNATEAGDVRLASAAVAGGANVNARLAGRGNMTVLHAAIALNQPLVAARLLALRASAKACDSGGAAALHHAAAHGDTDMVRALLKSGAALEARTGAGVTPLLLAARNGHADTLQVLVGEGADVLSADGRRRTALHHAAAQGHAAACVVLLRAGANVWSKALEGGAAEDVARDAGYEELGRGLAWVAECRDKGDFGAEEEALDALARPLSVVPSQDPESGSAHASRNQASSDEDGLRGGVLHDVPSGVGVDFAGGGSGGEGGDGEEGESVEMPSGEWVTVTSNDDEN